MRKREKFNGNICNNNENYTFYEISTCERLINDHDLCTHTHTNCIWSLSTDDLWSNETVDLNEWMKWMDEWFFFALCIFALR